MDKQELQKLLEQLHHELEKIDNVDPQGQTLLRELEGDIHELLVRSEGGESTASSSSLQRLENSIEYFEVTHPTLSATLVKLLAVLGNAGI